MSTSPGSKVPSASPMSNRVRNSASVMDSRGESSAPSAARVPLVIHCNTITNGHSRSSTALSGRAYRNAMRSELWTAKVLGTISPNTRRASVPATVATTTPVFWPSRSTAMTVTTAVKATFTRLLPSRIVASSLSGCSSIPAIRRAPGTLLLTKWATRTLSSDRYAASELEKKAEQSTKATMRNRLSKPASDTATPPTLARPGANAPPLLARRRTPCGYRRPASAGCADAPSCVSSHSREAAERTAERPNPRRWRWDQTRR